MARLSKPFYLVSIIGSFVLGLLLIGAGVGLILASGFASENAAFREEMFSFSILFLLGGIALGAYGTVVFCLLWHRAWESIQDGHARTTPAKAVGFIFIPLFNLYWIFPMIRGFAEDYNAYIARHDIAAPPLPEKLFLACCICWVLQWPASMVRLNILLGPASFILMLIVIVKVVNAVNEIPSPEPPGAPWPPLPA